jgi:hypothetical protein
MEAKGKPKTTRRPKMKHIRKYFVFMTIAAALLVWGCERKETTPTEQRQEQQQPAQQPGQQPAQQPGQ